MYLFDFLFTLGAHVPVRIKFMGSKEPFCFVTGQRNTGKAINDLSKAKKGGAKVINVYPLWHAQELYIECD